MRLERQLWAAVPRAAAEAFPDANICMAAPSTWVMLFNLGHMQAAAELAPAVTAAALSLRTLRWPDATRVADSRWWQDRDGVVVWCSFCWWRRSRSRRLKQRAHSGHSKGFSWVCVRSCRFRCSRRAKERWQAAQTCGRVLSGSLEEDSAIVLTLMLISAATMSARSAINRTYHDELAVKGP